MTTGEATPVRRRWPWLAAALVTVTIVAIGGVLIVRQDSGGSAATVEGGDGDGDDAGAPGLVLQPGDPLANGFVVADGTTVPGGLFPVNWDQGAALLTTSSVQVEVPGDMTTALLAYVHQAEDLGYTLRANNLDAACWQTLTGAPDEGAAPEGSAPTPSQMNCGVGGEREYDDGTAEFVSIQAERTYPDAVTPREFFRIEFTTGSWDRQPRTTSAVAMVLPEAGSGPPRPDTPLEFPGTVDPLCGPSLNVVEGSRIISAQAQCGSGYIVALEVTGVPEDVYEDYVEQIRAYDPEYARTESDTVAFENRLVRTDWAYWDDSSQLEARRYDDDLSGPPVIWITYTAG